MIPTLRQETEQRHGRAISDKGWLWLETKGHVIDAEAYDDRVAHLLDVIRERAEPLFGPSEREERVTGKLGDQLATRARAVSRVYAALAADESSASGFRDDWLPRLLRPNEVAGWVLNHYDGDKPNADGVRRFKTRGEVRRRSFAKGSRERGDLWVRSLSADALCVLTYATPVSEGEWQAERLSVRRGSVLGQLARVCADLSERFAWDEPEAAMFVLTGSSPYVAPIRGTLRRTKTWINPSSRMTIEVDPVTSPEELRHWYRAARRSVVGVYKPMREKNLELAAFSAENLPGPTYAELRTLWNETYPAWSYSGPSAIKQFARDSREAQRALEIPVAAQHPSRISSRTPGPNR